MFSFNKKNKFDCYLNIDLIISINNGNENNKALFSLKNKNIIVEDNIIDQSNPNKVTKNKLF